MGSKTMRNVVIGVLVGILAFWAATVPVLMLCEDDIAKRGLIGDAFGSINALFSGLALAGVIVAILLQREELRLQRQELKETRAVFERQAAAAERQEDALREQQRIGLLQAVINAHASLYEGGIADRAAAMGAPSLEKHIHRIQRQRGAGEDEVSLRRFLGWAEAMLSEASSKQVDAAATEKPGTD